VVGLNGDISNCQIKSVTLHLFLSDYIMVRCLLFIFVIVFLPQIIFSQVSRFDDFLALNAGRISGEKVHFSSVDKLVDFESKIDHINLSKIAGISGNSALFNDTLQKKVVRSQWIKGATVPAVLIAAGTITLLPPSYCFLSKYTIHDKVLELLPGINTPIDNYLQFAPMAAVFGLKAAGVKSRSNFINQCAITAKAELLMLVIVHGMKNVISSDRPNIGTHSMPSGHTAQAFVSATILNMEYRDTSPWIGYAGYAAAITTGIGRMVNDKHWISDVLIGAGIGIFSTKVVYYTHRYRWGRKNNVVILPAIYKNGGGVSFAMIL
jgi:membrane-associated phospholipid phosphatase